MKKLFFVILFFIGLLNASASAYATIAPNQQFSKSFNYTQYNKCHIGNLPKIWLADTESDDLQEQENDDNSHNSMQSFFYNSINLTFLSNAKRVDFLTSKEILPNSLFIFYSVFRI